MSKSSRILILDEAGQLLDKYEREPEHTRHVSRLAGQLFDGLAAWHQLGDRERTWLVVAGLLHDLGWSQTRDGAGHHKWSARLISAFPWQSLPPEEVAIVAQTARYHRKSLPCPQHSDYMSLPAEHRIIVSRLAALLRVADALDRTHRQIVAAVTATLDEDVETITLHITSEEACQREQEAVGRKADLLRALTHRNVLMSLY
ncbi:MAG: HD domain-containing protein [Candidatus Methylacidiphilales bacterium]|nr:HD domain-containing protein [Candidatus Methylacidiphilales bacterium]